MSTGFCFKTHACKGYACVHFVDERKNKQRQKDVKNKWLPRVQINNVSKSRRAKPVNWYSPPDKGSKKEKGFSLIQDNEYCNIEQISTEDSKGYWNNIIKVVNIEIHLLLNICPQY